MPEYGFTFVDRCLKQQESGGQLPPRPLGYSEYFWRYHVFSNTRFARQ